MVYFVHFCDTVRVSSRFGRVSRPAKIEKEPGVPVGLFSWQGNLYQYNAEKV